MSPPVRLELRKWATAGDEVLFHIYVGERRVGSGAMRSREWFEVERGNFAVGFVRQGIAVSREASA